MIRNVFTYIILVLSLSCQEAGDTDNHTESAEVRSISSSLRGGAQVLKRGAHGLKKAAKQVPDMVPAFRAGKPPQPALPNGSGAFYSSLLMASGEARLPEVFRDEKATRLLLDAALEFLRTSLQNSREKKQIFLLGPSSMVPDAILRALKVDLPVNKFVKAGGLNIIPEEQVEALFSISDSIEEVVFFIPPEYDENYLRGFLKQVVTAKPYQNRDITITVNAVGPPTKMIEAMNDVSRIMGEGVKLKLKLVELPEQNELFDRITMLKYSSDAFNTLFPIVDFKALKLAIKANFFGRLEELLNSMDPKILDEILELPEPEELNQIVRRELGKVNVDEPQRLESLSPEQNKDILNVLEAFDEVIGKYLAEKGINLEGEDKGEALKTLRNMDEIDFTSVYGSGIRKSVHSFPRN